MKTATLSHETLPNFVGQTLGSSSRVTRDQPCVAEFAHCTGDDPCSHDVVERAQRESPHPSTIAHGYLTLALAGPSAQIATTLAMAVAA